MLATATTCLGTFDKLKVHCRPPNMPVVQPLCFAFYTTIFRRQALEKKPKAGTFKPEPNIA